MNNAAILTMAGFLEMDPADFERTIDVNLTGVHALHAARAARNARGALGPDRDDRLAMGPDRRQGRVPV